MKLRKWIQVILIGSAVLTLVACHSNKQKLQNSALHQTAYDRNAQASGLGEESGFGEEEQSQGRHAARVYYFDFDSNVVHEQDKSAIIANANYLMAHPHVKVLVEGHTDPRGSREYNIGLGERRAKAVAEILAAKGVNATQIRIVSYGAEKLASPGRTEADYQRDRRVVLVYMR